MTVLTVHKCILLHVKFVLEKTPSFSGTECKLKRNKIKANGLCTREAIWEEKAEPRFAHRSTSAQNSGKRPALIYITDTVQLKGAVCKQRDSQ